MKHSLVLGCALVAALSSVARCSEEDVRAPHKISLWADAGPGFGKVSATLEVEPTKNGERLSSVVLSVRGQRLAVPPGELRMLRRPLIATAQFRTGGSRDGGPPWLYLVFLLGTPGAKEHPRAYIPIRNGRLHPVYIRTRSAVVRAYG